MRKIYVVGHSQGYSRWMEGENVKNMKDADLVVFTGGEDVDPDFYGEFPHPQTQSNRQRDSYEQAEFNEALQRKIPMLGICRGSQFLCVMNDGKLVQHQQNPAFYHDIKTYDGQKIEISSTHHQAAYPYNLPEDKYKVLGWTEGISKFHEDGNQEELNPPKECEIVYYPGTRCLGIQGHPEMMRIVHPTIAYLRDLLNKFLSNEIDTSKTVDTVQAEASLSSPLASTVA